MKSAMLREKNTIHRRQKCQTNQPRLAASDLKSRILPGANSIRDFPLC